MAMADAPDADARARARVGTTLKEKWRIDALLGQGGMATVYAATHRNGKRAAIKVLNPEIAAVPDLVSRFLREGYVANKVDHPGAVSVLDDDRTDEGLVYLVMELLDGDSLERVVMRAGGRLPLGPVVGIADQVLDVLAAAHERGIVHRDLKPENVFLLRDGRTKVLDFGIARLLEQTSPAGATQMGAVMGTPGFMPPEQARGRWQDVGPRTDLWALGATVFTLLTGGVVHDGETVNEALLSAMTKTAPPLATLVPEHPARILEIFDRALAFEPSARWESASAMQAALREAARALGLDTTVPALPARGAAPSRASIPDSAQGRGTPPGPPARPANWTPTAHVPPSPHASQPYAAPRGTPSGGGGVPAIAPPSAFGSNPPHVGSQPPSLGSNSPHVGSQPPSFGSNPPHVGSQPPSFGSNPPHVGSQPPVVSAASVRISGHPSGPALTRDSGVRGPTGTVVGTVVTAGDGVEAGARSRKKLYIAGAAAGLLAVGGALGVASLFAPGARPSPATSGIVDTSSPASPATETLTLKPLASDVAAPLAPPSSDVGAALAPDLPASSMEPAVRAAHDAKDPSGTAGSALAVGGKGAIAAAPPKGGASAVVTAGKTRDITRPQPAEAPATSPKNAGAPGAAPTAQPVAPSPAGFDPLERRK
jgi:serine/threonine-protein kinase